MATYKFIDSTGLSQVLSKIKATYVAQEAGKGLSTNDFTTELKTKLEGIAEGAQVNVIESVKVNGTALSVTEKAVDITVPTKHSDLGAVAETDLATELAQKINTVAEGNHSHANKEVIDGITAAQVEGWDGLDARVTANADAIGVLNGNTAVDGSVDKKIADAINKFATDVSDDGTVNTYKELIDYAASHGAEFTTLVGKVDGNTAAIATLNGDAATAGSVAKSIADAITAANLGQYATTANLTAATDRITAIEEDYVKASEMVALTSGEIDTIWNSVA